MLFGSVNNVTQNYIENIRRIEMNFISNPYAEVLQEIEQGLWEHDARVDEKIAQPYSYDAPTFAASLKIFQSAIMFALWEKQDFIGTQISDRMEEAEKMGLEIKELIQKYTGIDTHKLYE